jgi:hypothetical protein
MTHIEKRTAHKTLPARGVQRLRRPWYEYAGAELMALDLGIVIGALATRVLDWYQVIVIGAIGFLLACGGVYVAALRENVRAERLRANVSRGTLQKLKGVAPVTRDVPPEHRRHMKDGGDLR